MKSPVRLNKEHDTTGFDCGRESLNRFLQRYALQNDDSGSAFTYVILENNNVIGYYSFAVGSVERAETPPRIAKGLASHPVPILLLARLAIDRNFQNSGLGTKLMKDFLNRSCHLSSEHVPIRCVVVDAKDEESKAFYKRFNFEACPIDGLRMWILMKDLKRTLES